MFYPANENQETEGSEKKHEDIGNSVSSDDMYKIAYTDSCWMKYAKVKRPLIINIHIISLFVFR